MGKLQFVGRWGYKIALPISGKTELAINANFPGTEKNSGAG